MFSEGDKIVYPMYGAGIIEGLEQKEIDGVLQTYYVMRIPVGNLKIMISVGKAEYLGIREIYSGEQALDVIRSILNEPIVMSENWNQRYKENLERIKTGKLAEVALVFRNLLMRERERGLSSAEKKMLTTAKQIIVSELILARDMEKNTAEELLQKTVVGM